MNVVRKKVLCVVLFILIGLFEVRSQDSIQSVDYNLKFNISGRYISGVFSQFVYSNSLDFSLDFKRLTLQNNLSYRFNRTGNQTIENNWYELLSLSYYTKKKRLFPTVFYHFDNNLMFRVDERHLSGGGLSTIKQWKNSFLRADVGVGYDHSRFRGINFENSNLISDTRSRGVLLFRFQAQNKQIKNKLSLSTDFFYRHSLVERSDFLFIVTQKIALELFKNILIHSSYEYRFENVHLVGLSAFNSTLLFGLTFQKQGRVKERK